MTAEKSKGTGLDVPSPAVSDDALCVGVCQPDANGLCLGCGRVIIPGDVPATPGEAHVEKNDAGDQRGTG